jgi:hypothetical protein
VVFVGWDAESDRTAAIKLFNTVPKDLSGTISRVKRDAQAAGALGHPNVAAVLGVGTTTAGRGSRPSSSRA